MERCRMRARGRDAQGQGQGEGTAVGMGMGMGSRIVEVVLCNLVGRRDIVGLRIAVIAVAVAEIHLVVAGVAELLLVVAGNVSAVAEGGRDLVVGLSNRRVVLSG
jgi:hypothetical protein